MLIAARSRSAHSLGAIGVEQLPHARPPREPRGPRESPMADDRDYTHDENPHQGPSHSFGKNIGSTSDAERSIATGRETRNPSATRAPVRGGGGGAFALMRRMADDMDRLFENFGLGRAVGLGRGLPS